MRGSVVPANWRRKWRKIHNEFYSRTGVKWQADVLKRSLASNFAAHFKSYSKSQMEMGHSSETQLRTRYLAGVSAKDAEAFGAVRG